MTTDRCRPVPPFFEARTATLVVFFIVSGVACTPRGAPDPAADAALVDTIASDAIPSADVMLEAGDSARPFPDGVEADSACLRVDGTVVDLQTDIHNCGACGNDCAARGGQCVAGCCVNGDCTAGLSACCGSDHFHICVSLAVDLTNCGACGTMCSPGQVCISGSCR